MCVHGSVDFQLDQLMAAKDSKSCSLVGVGVGSRRCFRRLAVAQYRSFYVK